MIFKIHRKKTFKNNELAELNANFIFRYKKLYICLLTNKEGNEMRIFLFSKKKIE